jgi:hypothetical protein
MEDSRGIQDSDPSGTEHTMNFLLVMVVLEIVWIWLAKGIWVG